MGQDYLDSFSRLEIWNHFYFGGLRKNKQFLDKIKPTSNEQLPGTSAAPKRKRGSDGNSVAAPKKRSKAPRKTSKSNQWCALALWVILDRKHSCWQKHTSLTISNGSSVERKYKLLVGKWLYAIAWLMKLQGSLSGLKCIRSLGCGWFAQMNLPTLIPTLLHTCQQIWYQAHAEGSLGYLGR